MSIYSELSQITGNAKRVTETFKYVFDDGNGSEVDREITIASLTFGDRILINKNSSDDPLSIMGGMVAFSLMVAAKLEYPEDAELQATTHQDWIKLVRNFDAMLVMDLSNRVSALRVSSDGSSVDQKKLTNS